MSYFQSPVLKHSNSAENNIGLGDLKRAQSKNNTKNKNYDFLLIEGEMA